MNARCLLALLLTVAVVRSFGHEFPGHPEDAKPITLGTEIYVGKHGYWHGGVGVSVSLGRETTLDLGAHVVREESGAREVPSFEFEVIREFEDGWELEAFGFGYTEVERKQAWGLGMRVTKRYALSGGWSLALFVGPTYANVRAVQEETEAIEDIRHTLLLGGVTIEAGPFSLTLMASHSFYDGEVEGLETPVDLESMTHFAAYENNDGFALDTIAAEVAWEATRWLTLHARYAVMRLEDETRQAITFTPAVKLGEHIELTGGVQFLRGGDVENDLIFAGFSVRF